MSALGKIGTKQAKYWGTTQCVFVSETSEVHMMKINSGGFSSKHKHEKKWNRFIVISGKLKVIIYRDKGEEEIILGPGDITDVESGVYHRFINLEEETLCAEVYWIPALSEIDITREDTGGANWSN